MLAFLCCNCFSCFFFFNVFHFFYVELFFFYIYLCAAFCFQLWLFFYSALSRKLRWVEGRKMENKYMQNWVYPHDSICLFSPKLNWPELEHGTGWLELLSLEKMFNMCKMNSRLIVHGRTASRLLWRRECRYSRNQTFRLTWKSAYHATCYQFPRPWTF